MQKACQLVLAREELLPNAPSGTNWRHQRVGTATEKIKSIGVSSHCEINFSE